MPIFEIAPDAIHKLSETSFGAEGIRERGPRLAKFVEQAGALARREDRSFDAKRYFCEPDELIFANGSTFAFSSQWGTRTSEALATLLKAFPDKGFSFRANDSI